MKPSPQAVPEPEGETQGAAVTTTQLDPFSPANLRLSQSFTETVRVEKLLTTVPVRKPGPQDFVRVHPAAEYREHFPMVELRDEREEYIVTAGLVAELAGEFVYQNAPHGDQPPGHRVFLAGAVALLRRPRHELVEVCP
jgi:hypothetical protein